jgi:hypothetical protein
MTLVASYCTSDEYGQAPALVDELIDRYEVECQGFLQSEGNNVHKLVQATREAAPRGKHAVQPLVDALEHVIRNWDRVAQPIQLSARARGLSHSSSTEVAYAVRDLAIDLFNTYDLLIPSQRLTALLQECFAELPTVAERVQEDAATLDDIFQNRQKAESKQAEWIQSISYQVQLGTFFKYHLSISPDGVACKDQRYPLDSVTRVRWGGVHHSSGATYTIAFGDAKNETVVELNREEVFTEFIDKLWRAVGIRMLMELLNALRAGQEVRIGSVLIRDDGVTLSKHYIFTANERVFCSWHQTKIWLSDGMFYIGAQDDEHIYTGLSYLQHANVHILEQAIRMAFKLPHFNQLSDLL